MERSKSVSMLITQMGSCFYALFFHSLMANRLLKPTEEEWRKPIKKDSNVVIVSCFFERPHGNGLLFKDADNNVFEVLEDWETIKHCNWVRNNVNDYFFECNKCKRTFPGKYSSPLCPEMCELCDAE